MVMARRSPSGLQTGVWPVLGSEPVLERFNADICAAAVSAV